MIKLPWLKPKAPLDIFEQAEAYGIDTLNMTKERVEIEVDAAKLVRDVLGFWEHFLERCPNFKTAQVHLVYKGQRRLYSVVFQRAEGMTPAQMLQAQKAEIAAKDLRIAEIEAQLREAQMADTVPMESVTSA